jgi:hypothetical protein
LKGPGVEGLLVACIATPLISKSHDAEKDEGDADVYYWFSIHKKVPLSSKRKRLVNSRAPITIDPYLEDALARKRPLPKLDNPKKEYRLRA